jgi:hypothetical protein
MAKLRNKDIRKVIQLFDNELLMVPRVSKIDKMKMRKKIINVVQPALNSPTMKPEVFILEVEKKLSAILLQFTDSYGFRNRLTDLIRKLNQKAKESSTPPPFSDDQ